MLAVCQTSGALAERVVWIWLGYVRRVSITQAVGDVVG